MLVKKIFLSGASGFVGRPLAKYLNKKKIGVKRVVYKSPIYEKSIKVDLTKRIYLKKKFDWIIHTAAHHKIEDFETKPKLKGKRNILMIKNLVISGGGIKGIAVIGALQKKIKLKILFTFLQ